MLVVPTVAAHRSFLAAWDEFGPEYEWWLGARVHGPEQWELSRSDAEDPEAFARLVEGIRAEALPETELPPDYVHQTVLWFLDGVTWLGRLSIRHELTPALRALGGHIGYTVRPSARGRGYATQMLAQALPIAASLGIDPALLTCEIDNLASRKVIEAAGGELEDEFEGKLRFWVPTRMS